MNDNWPKYTITAVIGMIAGIMGTHTIHGTKISDLEARIIQIQRSIEALSAKLDQPRKT